MVYVGIGRQSNCQELDLQVQKAMASNRRAVGSMLNDSGEMRLTEMANQEGQKTCPLHPVALSCHSLYAERL